MSSKTLIHVLLFTIALTKVSIVRHLIEEAGWHWMDAIGATIGGTLCIAVVFLPLALEAMDDE